LLAHIITETVKTKLFGICKYKKSTCIAVPTQYY